MAASSASASRTTARASTSTWRSKPLLTRTHPPGNNSLWLIQNSVSTPLHSSGKGHWGLFTPSALALALSGALALLGAGRAADGQARPPTTGSRWATGARAGIPDATTDVFINTSAGNPIAVNGGNAAAQNVTVGDVAGSNGILAISNAGTLEQWDWRDRHAAGSKGMVTVTGPNSLLEQQHILGRRRKWHGHADDFAMALRSASAGDSAVGFPGRFQRHGHGRWRYLTNGGSLQIGRSGAGMLTIQNAAAVSAGGFVSVGDAWIDWCARHSQRRSIDHRLCGSIGGQLGSVGTVTIDGVGSKWINNGAFFAGVTVETKVREY